VLGSNPGTPTNALGGRNPQASRPQDPRTAAAEAAERRLQAVSIFEVLILDHLLNPFHRPKNEVQMLQIQNRASSPSN